MPDSLVAVTGGSGYVGVNLVPQLLGRGARVRVLDRVRHTLLADEPVEFRETDVRDRSALRAAFDGVQVVYHLAAVISVTGDQGGLVADVNVGGAGAAAAAARAAGVERFVYCGSVHAFDTDAPGPITEAGPRATRTALPAYDRSKAAAEEAIRREVDRGLDAVLLNPTGIIGPRDPGPSRTGQVLRAMRAGRLPAVVEGGFDWVDVRDVAAGLLHAREHGRTGENYLLAGHRRSLRELADTVAELTGQPAARFTLPMWFARIWSPAATLVARRTGSALLYTDESLHAIASFPQVSDRKARSELGHRPRPLEDTLRELFAWFESPAFAQLHPGRARR